MELDLPTSFVASLTGASVRQVGYWLQTGLLGPSRHWAVGQGRSRRYAFVDVVALMTIAKLRELGCPLQTIRKAVRYLRQHYPQSSDSHTLACLTLLTDGTNVYMLTDEHEVMEVTSRQLVWSVPLGLLIRQAEAGIKKLPKRRTETVRIGGKKYHLLLVWDAETDTYAAQCKELPGAIEQGDTIQQAIANGKEAIRSALTFMAKHRTRRSKHAKAV